MIHITHEQEHVNVILIIIVIIITIIIIKMIIIINKIKITTGFNKDLERKIGKPWGIRHLKVILVLAGALGVVCRLDVWVVEKPGINIRMVMMIII